MDLKICKIKNIISNLYFIISVTIFTFLLIHIESIKQTIFSVFVSFTLTAFLTFKFKIREKIFENNNNVKIKYLSIFLAIASSFCIGNIFYAYHIVVEPTRSIFINSPIPDSLIMYVLIFLSLYATYTFYYFLLNTLLPKAKEFFKNLEKNEKHYLIISTCIFSLAIIIIYSITNIFYAPRLNNEVQAFDVIFSSDTGAHGILNDYLDITAIENDIRQPLFGVFSFPFSIIAYMIGNLFNNFNNGYFILIAIIQVFLMNITSILLSRLLNLNKIKQTLFLMFYTVSYPFILFAFNLEQYVFGMFWLMCFLYSYIQNKEGSKFCFIVATGSLITNGILFPLLTSGKKIKKWFADFIQTLFAFLSGIIIFGQLPLILNIFSTGITHVSKYITKNTSFFNILCQYSNFVTNCFIAPFNTIVEERLGHPSFQLAPAETLSILGCIIFILVILGFILNRKDKFAKICFSWIIFSIVLLIVLGYGTRENGLILYSLYFNWAFVSLIFLLFKKLLGNKKKIFVTISVILIVLLLVCNIKGLIDLIQFGLQYFDHMG